MAQPAGRVEYPDYISTTHAQLLYGNDGTDPANNFPTLTNTVNMAQLLDTAIGVGNPYENAAAYDPADDIALSQDKIDAIDQLANIIDASITWDELFTEAIARVDEAVPTSAEIESDVSSFRDASEVELARAYTRVTASMQDINAVISSAFPTALSNLEHSHNMAVAQHRSQLRSAHVDVRARVAMESVNSMVRLLGVKVQTTMGSSSSQMGLMQFQEAAFNRQVSTDLEYLTSEVTWEMDLNSSGAKTIGATSGIPGMSKGMPQWMAAAQIAGGAVNSLTSLASIPLGLAGMFIFG